MTINLVGGVQDLYEALGADPAGYLTWVNFQGHCARARGIDSPEEGYYTIFSAPEVSNLLGGIGEAFAITPWHPGNRYCIGKPGIFVQDRMAFVERWARAISPENAEAAMAEFTLRLMEGQ